MVRSSCRPCGRRLPLSLLALAMSSPTLANVALEEVVVTAQKRQESLQDTPISLAAFGSEALEAKGIHTLADLRANVPNLQLTPHPSNTTALRVFMRGVGNNDTQVSQDPSVAVYLDGVYVARSQGLSMEVADIERVEVLRGPQGSLYGRNATGGAINFITRAPTLEEFHFTQALTSGSDNLFRSRTQVNVPLGDEVAVQLAYLDARRHGVVRNAGSGEPRFGEQDRAAWQLSALWQPGDDFKARYTFDHSQIDDTSAYVTAVPLFPAEGERPHRGSSFVNDLRPNDITAQGHNLMLEWQANAALTVRSITGYRELDNRSYQDYLTGAHPLLPTLALNLSATDYSQEQFSQEFQLIGQALDERLEYVAGLYYFNEEVDGQGRTATPPRSSVASSRYAIENTAYAAYGQGTWTPAVLNDRLHITLGARWSEDQRQSQLRELTSIANSPAAVTREGDGDKDFDDVSPSLVLAYDLNDDTNVYGKVVKGYKTGGFNERASSSTRFNRGFDPETLLSYELGVKSELWDRRLRVNAAVFHADYDDIQINVQSDPGNIRITDVLNAGKASIDGVELDITALLTERLTATLNYGYLNGRYEEIRTAAGDVASQFEFVNSPQHSYSASLEYAFPSTPVGELTARLDYSWQDEKFSSASVSSTRYLIDDYGLLNARLTLSEIPVGAGDLRVALWGKNLENETYYLDHFNAGLPAAVFGDPRSYGIDVIYEY